MTAPEHRNRAMLIRFWGTRGSFPAPLDARAVRGKIKEALTRSQTRSFADETELDAFIANDLDFAVVGTFGGNTSCVEIDGGSDSYVLCDLGTGVREFGNRFLSSPHPAKRKVFNIFMSHVHWDHIMGFPFFVPAYIPGHKIRIHGCHEILEQAFRMQHGAPSFPVDFDLLGADISFVPLTPGERHEIAGMAVYPFKQVHEGGSYAYRFEKDGKSVVYATDAEHKIEDRGAYRVLRPVRPGRRSRDLRFDVFAR